ncbi:MAG: hypothetical protein K0Q71_5211 [Thermomicrobiales bacterium]|nr:hypothetical protein [Thermomicrobiales bacterium]
MVRRHKGSKRAARHISGTAAHAGNDPSVSVANGAVPGQPDAVMWAYAHEDALDRALRDITASEQHVFITAWLFGLDLFAAAFGPDSDRGTSARITPAGDASFPLRCQLLARAARAAKPTLDLILSGYYREAWALERTMLDEWAQSIYLRLQPTDGPVPTCEPTWRESARVIVDHGDERDRSLLAEATAHWEFLAVGVRPLSGQTVAPLDADPQNGTFQAAYHAPSCALALSCGLFIQVALLAEVAALEGHPEAWLTWYATFVDVAGPLHRSGRSEMEQLTQERAERCTGVRPPR